MKKSIILATILGMTFTLAGCAGGANNLNPVTPDEPDVVIDDTDYVEEDDDIEYENQPTEYGIYSIIGVYGEADTIDGRTLTIEEDGSYTLAYKGGGAQYGTVAVTEEETPDGNINYWFTFTDDAGEVWESFSMQEGVGVQTDLYSGQDGSLHFVLLDETATGNDEVFDKFFGAWGYERCGITIEQRGEEAVVVVSWSNGAAESYEWTYFCTYNADEYTLESYSGQQVLYSHDYDTDEDTVTVVNEEAKANFYINGKGRLIWEDLDENSADGMEFEFIQ
ncbi:MAG: hypothetical protein K5776_09880 [Lachnospiraceae bacterium]|nr:hypothetical protein [Lachnospiraceae bacterium]